MSIYTIYKATNTINGKSYIGFTSFELSKRISEHLENVNNKHKKTKLYSSIKKYGNSAFLWEIIYQSKDKEHTLKEMEPYFIKEYNTHYTENGYNMTIGGDGVIGYVYSDELKKIMGEISKNRTRTQEWKDNIGKANTGRKHTKEYGEAIRKRQLGKKRTPHSIKTKLKMKKNNKNYSREVLEETKIKISLKRKGTKQNPTHILNQKKSYRMNRIQNLSTDCVYMPY